MSWQVDPRQSLLTVRQDPTLGIMATIAFRFLARLRDVCDRPLNVELIDRSPASCSMPSKSNSSDSMRLQSTIVCSSSTWLSPIYTEYDGISRIGCLPLGQYSGYSYLGTTFVIIISSQLLSFMIAIPIQSGTLFHNFD
jgi:hypothetical protein